MNELKLHHVGLIVSDIQYYQDCIPHGDLLNDVVDPVQNARLKLFKNFGPSYLELIQPLSEKSRTWNQLQSKSNHINHFCYKLDNRECINSIATNFQIRKISDWMPAVLFPGCEVCFYYSKANIILEFLTRIDLEELT